MSGLFGLWGHGWLRGLLSSYADGRLDERRVERLEQHLAECARCRWELDTLQNTVGLLRSLPRIVPHRTFTLAERPMAVPAAPACLWGMRAATSAAALALVLLFAGDILGVFSREVASPADSSLQAQTWERAELKSAVGDQAPSSLAAIDATSPVPTSEEVLEAPAPLPTAEEETLPVGLLEATLGGLLVVLALLTLLATWRLQRHRALVWRG